MLVSFSTFPVDKGVSMSGDVARAIELIHSSGLKYQTTSMGTLVEGEWDDVMALVKKCHHEIKKNSQRVYTVISIDDRTGAKDSLNHKVASIEKALGHEVRK